MLKKLRKHYGISQELLAIHLRVKRSYLAMAEGYRRKMPESIMGKLMPLYSAIDEVHTGKADEALERSLEIQQRKLGRLIKKRMIANEYFLMRARKILSKMKADQAKALQILQNVQFLLAKSSTKQDTDLLNSIDYRARELQIKTSLDVQLKWELQLQAMKAEMEWLKKLVPDSK